MFDNENLKIGAETVIGPREFIPNASGGAYFTLDEDENSILDYEVLQNSIAVDEDAIYMVTCAALYRISADAEGDVQIDRRAPYDMGTDIGGILPGSGTSPTLLGTEDDLITICDNDDAIINSAQLATESGVNWGYGADPGVEDEDLFYLGAHDWETGDEIFRTCVGDGRPFNPIAGQVHIHPDGALYLGSLGGVTLMRDLSE